MKTTAISPNAISLRQHARDHNAQSWLSLPSRDSSSTPPPVHLTPRQREVLCLLCEGLPNKLICRRLNISAGTVKVHIGSIFRELGVASRLQAVVSAQRCRLDLDAFVSVPEGSQECIRSADSARATASRSFAAAA